MQSIKLLLCVLLTAMSFNVFADEVGRYQMLNKTPDADGERKGVYVLDTKTGVIRYCALTITYEGMTCLTNSMKF